MCIYEALDMLGGLKRNVYGSSRTYLVAAIDDESCEIHKGDRLTVI